MMTNHRKLFETQLWATSKLPNAVLCFVGGLLGEDSVSLDTLQQRVGQHNQKTKQDMDTVLKHALPQGLSQGCNVLAGALCGEAKANG